MDTDEHGFLSRGAQPPRLLSSEPSRKTRFLNTLSPSCDTSRHSKPTARARLVAPEAGALPICVYLCPSVVFLLRSTPSSSLFHAVQSGKRGDVQEQL